MIFYRYDAYNNDNTGTITTTSTGIEFRKEMMMTSICILAWCMFFIYSTNNYLLMIVYRHDMYDNNNACTWKGPNDETVIWALGLSFLFILLLLY